MDTCYYCYSPDVELCKFCDLVYSCKKHLSVHRLHVAAGLKEGKTDCNGSESDTICLPFKVRELEGKGNALVAVRDIKPFEVIFKDKPAIIGLFDNDEIRCLECFRKPEKFHDCSKCSLPLCSKECENGKRHEPECNFYQNKRSKNDEGMKSNTIITSITAIRLLAVKNDPDRVEEWERIDNLEDHVQQRRKRPGWRYIREGVLPTIESVSDHKVDDQLVERLIGIVRTNSVRWDLTVPGEEKKDCVGHGLCPIFSLLCHSCVSNTRYIQTNDCMTVVACVPIKAGEEITSQYRGPTEGSILRKKDFLQQWFFECSCIRCRDVTELGTMASCIRCSDCGKDTLLPRTPDIQSEWACTNCGFTRDYESVLEFTSSLEKSVSKKSYKDSVESWEDLLKELEPQLHPNHFLCMYVKRNILQLYGSRESHLLTKLSRQQLEYKIGLCENYIEIYSKLEPGYRAWKSRVLEELLPTYASLMKIRLENKEIGKTEYIMCYKYLLNIIKEAAKCRQFELQNSDKEWVSSFYNTWLGPLEQMIAA